MLVLRMYAEIVFFILVVRSNVSPWPETLSEITTLIGVSEDGLNMDLNRFYNRIFGYKYFLTY